MKTSWRAEKHGWVTDGKKITSSENLGTIQKVLEDEGPIIVEHAFYCGASAPDWMMFEDYDDFINYLENKAAAGDWITVWSFWRVCRTDNAIADGECPADDGCVPTGGAY